MSNFYRRTKNPATGEFEDALWIDDHFGRHRYGVQFPSNGVIYRQSDHEWEFDDKLVESRPRGFSSGPTATAEHPQLYVIRKALSDLESLRDAAVCNGVSEQKLATYLRAACKCVELALMEAAQKR